MTATIPNLDWRTFHIAIGTIDTTITFERLQNDTAAFAVIEILAGVSRHNVFRYVTAFGTGQRGTGNHYRLVRLSHLCKSPS